MWLVDEIKADLERRQGPSPIRLKLKAMGLLPEDFWNRIEYRPGHPLNDPSLQCHGRLPICLIGDQRVARRCRSHAPVPTNAATANRAIVPGSGTGAGLPIAGAVPPPLVIAPV